jgi:AAA+ ATPase superfamily predicted ATPase
MINLQVGKPVIGDQLIGRETELNTILQLLQQGQSVVIIAPRRYGKTSIILELLRRLKSLNYYTASVDVFSTPDIYHLAERITENVLKNNKLDSAFKKVKSNISEIIKNIKLRQVIEDFEFILQFSDKPNDTWDLFSNSLDFIENYSKKKNKKIICAFDEFGDINKLDGEKIVKLFRSKIQLHQQATYIFSGSYESVMDSLFIKSNSPFFRFARVINLGYINHDDYSGYLVKIFRKEGIETGKVLAENILRFTNGHPYYTQLVLQQILINKSFRIFSYGQGLGDVFKQLLSIERNYLEKVWEDISKNNEQVQVLITVAGNKQSVYAAHNPKKINISRTIRRLMGSGMIYKTGKSYKFTDPLLELWIQENVLK